MNSLTFDTLKYANALKAAGVEPRQAEAQAGALSEVLEVSHKELATKGDVAALKNDITALEHRMDSRFIQLEQRMTIKLGTMLTVAVGATVALGKLL
ncbi:MAG: CCDC90 family protein [Gallionellaceae bacterium]|jgi:hypothetical protein|nr:CCDC90 family protein [Gallionellaceae bacterium]